MDIPKKKNLIRELRNAEFKKNWFQISKELAIWYNELSIEVTRISEFCLFFEIKLSCAFNYTYPNCKFSMLGVSFPNG